jgi:hypothetical protein
MKIVLIFRDPVLLTFILIFVIFTLVFIIVKSLKRNDELELFTASQKLLSNYSLSLYRG